MHVSQLAGNNLHVMSGLRRQPTCWAAPWRSSPLPSSSTRPRAPCPEPALFARLLTKMARQMQVLHATFTTIFFTLYSSQYPPFSLPFLFCHSHSIYTCTHICCCSSLKGKMQGREKVKLILVMNTTALQWLLTDRCAYYVGTSNFGSTLHSLSLKS